MMALRQKELERVEELWRRGAGAWIVVTPEGVTNVYGTAAVYMRFTAFAENGLEYGIEVPPGVMNATELKRLLRELEPPPLLPDVLKFLAEKVIPRLHYYGVIKKIEVEGAEKWRVVVTVYPKVGGNE